MIINQQPDLVVCGAAASSAQAKSAVAALKPDMAAVDISLGDSSGLNLIKDLHILNPTLPVLALSMHDESLYAERCLRAGARGYLMKREPTSALLTALRQVLAGKIYVSQRIADRLMERAAGRIMTGPQSPGDLLTDRELEVFQFLSEGRSTSQVAKALHLSMKTVSAHRENIKRKLGCKNASELVRFAISWAQQNQID